MHVKFLSIATSKIARALLRLISLSSATHPSIRAERIKQLILQENSRDHTK